MPIQEELKPQTAEEELNELYEEEPRRRSWAAIMSVVLALVVIFVGYQWNQAAGREQVLASQLHALRADAETLRLRAEEAQRQVEVLKKRAATVTAEKEALADRVAALEKTAQQRVAASREAGRERASAREGAAEKATPVVAKKRAAR